MAASDSLENHFRDQLAVLGGVSVRRMFGAACLFKDGLAFAIVDDGTLFLKAGDELKAEMKQGGGRPFTYQHKTRGAVEMSYSSPPDSAFDDVEELVRWGRRCFACAVAKNAARPLPKKRSATATAKKAPAKKKPAKKKPAKKKPAKKKPSR